MNAVARLALAGLILALAGLILGLGACDGSGSSDAGREPIAGAALPAPGSADATPEVIVPAGTTTTGAAIPGTPDGTIGTAGPAPIGPTTAAPVREFGVTLRDVRARRASDGRAVSVTLGDVRSGSLSLDPGGR